MANEQRELMRESFKDYQNCLDYCGLDKNTSDDEKAGCINEIRSDYGEDMCKVEEVCPIIGTPKYIRLVLIFKEVLRFIYTSRKEYGNKFDVYLVPMVSSIPLDDLGISLEELSCIKFPGHDSFTPKFPKTLSEYLILFNQLMNEEDQTGVNIEGWLAGLSSKRQNMNYFISDFQPWTRTLSMFVRNNGLEIPLIERSDKYGTFVSDEYLAFMKDLQSQGLLKDKDIISIDALKKGHKQIIEFLMAKLPRMGGSKRSKRKTRNKRKSKTIKKRK
jgi:hypothetical protein